MLKSLDELRLRLEEAMWGDLSDTGLVRHIAHLRRCIQYKEAVARGENRHEAWARAFDQPLERNKRIQARAAEIAAIPPRPPRRHAPAWRRRAGQLPDWRPRIGGERTAARQW